MPGEIIVHIGFHKTATTYLQKNIFPILQEYQFVGRKFGDLNYGEDLYLQVMEVLCHPEYSRSAIEECKNQLHKELESCNIVLSDEWLTSNYDGFYGGEGASWRTKIERLFELLNGLNSRVLLLRRELFDNAFSLFCEFSQIDYGDKYRDFFEFCKCSPDVEALVNGPEFIGKIFKEKLVILEYEKASPDFYSVLRQFNVEELPVINGSVNSKREQDNAVVINKRSKFLVSLRRSPMVRYLLNIGFTNILIKYIKPFVLFVFTRQRLMMKMNEGERALACRYLEERRISS